MKKQQTVDLHTTLCSYIFAPTVVAFDMWLLQQAKDKGIKRLYFLARDGYQFYKSAQILNETLHYNIDIRYLECSRYSLRIPLFSKMGEDALDYICLRGMDVSFASMMKRAGLEETDIVQVAREIDYTEDIHKSIPLTDIAGFKEVLKNSAYFMKRMTEISESAFENAVGYLRQEGLLDQIPSAIVDSGWTGSTQVFLKKLMIEVGGDPAIQGFYWGLYDLPQGVEEAQYHTYFFSWKRDYLRKSRFSNSLFEAIYSAPESSAIGYEREGEVYTTTYCGKSSPQAKIMDAQTELVIEYTRLFLQQELEGAYDVGVIAKLWSVLMSEPSMEEAKFLGQYLFSDDVTEDVMHSIAVELSEDELLSGHIFEKFRRLYIDKRLPVRESAWYEGSAVLYSKRAKWHQRAYRRYKILIYVRKELGRKR